MTPFIHIKMNLEAFVNNFGAEYIKSRSNPRCVALSKLDDKKYRDSCRLFLAEGVKLTSEALRHADVECVAVSASAAQKNVRAEECASAAKEKNVPVLLLDDAVFDKVSTEKAPQGVLAAVRYMKDLHVSDNFEQWQKNRRIIMLNEVRDPGNLGTVMRTAEALGVGGVVMSGCADIYNPKTVRAAMGTIFRMPVYISDDAVKCIGEMKKLGRRTIAASLGENTLTLGKYEIKASDCPIIGNEGHGLPESVISAAGCSVMIPMAGETESLNAASAAACILWEYFRSCN